MRPKELCEVLHISENVIKKYKKQGVFFPEHPSEGNRATDYTETDMLNLKKLLVLSKAGLTCNDLKKLQGNEINLQDALKARRTAIDDKLEKMRNSLDMLVTLLDDEADFDDFQTEHYWDDVSEKEAAGEEFMDFAMYEYQPTSLEQVIKCPHCGHQEEVDLKDYLYDESPSEKENGMGPDIVYSFDSDESYVCPKCNHIIQIEGWIREYPIGAYDSDSVELTDCGEKPDDE